MNYFTITIDKDVDTTDELSQEHDTYFMFSLVKQSLRTGNVEDRGDL